MASVTQLIAARVRELRGKKSRATIVREMAVAGYELTEDGLKKIETEPGRVPAAETIRGLAAVLGVAPETFHEYPIAVAREEAAATPAAGRRRVADAARKAAQRRSGRQSKLPEDPRSKPKGGRAA